MTLSVTHAKTNSITDWTQAQLDAQIALGNFPPGTLLANITLPSDWNAGHTIAGAADTVTVADESADTTTFPLFVTAATGDLAPKTNAGLTFNSSSGLLTSTLLSAGNLNVTSSTIPAAGDYLAAANTLGLSARSLVAATFTNPASAVNYIAFTGSATGVAASFTNAGTDTNGAGLGIKITGKSATASGAGGPITINAGNGLTSGAGGAISMTGGTAGNSSNPSGGAITLTGGTTPGGNGGAVNLVGGAGTGGTFSGGAVNITGGSGASATNAGNVTLKGGPGATTSGAGGTSTVLGGNGGSTSGAGGAAALTGGVPTSGAGGAVTVTGANGVASNNVGGNASITAGNSVGSGTGASVSITAGRSVTGTAGAVTITSGAGGSTSGDAGAVTLIGGTPVAGNGGPINITGSAGVGTDKNGGSINLTPGAATGTGTTGSVEVTGGKLNTTISSTTVTATPTIEDVALNGLDLLTWTPATNPDTTSVFVTNRMRKTIVDVGTASITGTGVSHPIAGYDYLLMQGNTNTLDYAFVHESKFKKTGTGTLTNISFYKPAIDSIAGTIAKIVLFDGDMDLSGVTVSVSKHLMKTTRTDLPIETASKIIGALGKEVISSEIPGLASGRYYFSRNWASSGTVAPNRNLIIASPPIIIPERTTFTKIGIACTAGVASVTARLGLYKWTSGVPDVLVLDAGTVSLAASGDKEITINTTLEAGAYFPVSQYEGGAADPTVRALTFSDAYLEEIYGNASSNPAAATAEDWMYAAHTGAFAPSFGAATRLRVGAMPAVYLKL